MKLFRILILWAMAFSAYAQAPLNPNQLPAANPLTAGDKFIVQAQSGVCVNSSTITGGTCAAVSTAIAAFVQANVGAAGDTTSTVLGALAYPGNSMYTAGWNTAVGYMAMENSTGCYGGSGKGYDTAIGWESLLVDTGCENTGVGVNSLLSNTTGTFNVAIGNDSESHATTGFSNVGIGHSACGGGASDGAATGSFNVCDGVGSGSFISGAASFNVFEGGVAGEAQLGAQNTASDNVGVGWGTLQFVSSGNANTCIGFAACEGVSGAPLTAQANVAVGASALQSAQGSTTHNNVAIGYDTLDSLIGGNYDTCVGNQSCPIMGSDYFTTVLGANAGNQLNGGYANTLIGYGVAATTLATGHDNLIIGTGSSSCDTSSASTSNTVELCAGSTAVVSVTGAGTPQTSVTTVAGTLGTNGYAIGSLPTCNSGLTGKFTYVTNGQASPPYLGAVSSTGAVTAPVFCNGSGWVYH